MYFEGQNGNQYDIAELNCDVVPLARCLRFYYHSYGISTGRLRVTQFSATGDQSEQLMTVNAVNGKHRVYIIQATDIWYVNRFCNVLFYIINIYMVFFLVD